MRSFRPTILVPLASLLVFGALASLARVHQLGTLGQLIPDAWLQLASVVIAIGLLLRGVAGIGWALGANSSSSSSLVLTMIASLATWRRPLK